MNVKIEIDLGGGSVTQAALDDSATKAEEVVEEHDFDADLVGDALVRNVRLSVLPRLFNGHALTDTDPRRASFRAKEKRRNYPALQFRQLFVRH